jgi:hypothetical protein
MVRRKKLQATVVSTDMRSTKVRLGDHNSASSKQKDHGLPGFVSCEHLPNNSSRDKEVINKMSAQFLMVDKKIYPDGASLL